MMTVNSNKQLSNWKYLLCFFFIFSVNKIFCQDKAPVNFGTVKPADFNITTSMGDSGINAIIVLDKADISFEGNKKGWFTYVYKRITRINIINKNGFSLATVEIPLYQNDESKETVAELSAKVYNMSNGKVSETSLADQDVYTEKKDIDHYSKKFTLPNLQEGSIIEYTYTVKSDFNFNLPFWAFQSVSAPTLWSEFTVAIPSMLTYMSVFQGLHKFDIDKSSEAFSSYNIVQTSATGAYGTDRAERLTVSAPVIKHRWVMKNVPVFNIENFISSPYNYIDKISFQLTKTYNGEEYHDVANNWKKVTEELMKQEDFGKPLNEENSWLDKILAGIVRDNDNSFQTAERIYYYIQNNFACINHNDNHIKTSLQDVVKKKSGTVGDINLLLISMLKHRNIVAFPVLLSTTEFGRNSPTYPLLERLNYVIAKININSTDYFLDATIPFLPFGKLPLNCYNGHARVISNDTTAIYFDAGSLKETSKVNVIITQNDNKGPAGEFTRTMGFFESLDTKTTIAKSTLHAFETNLKKGYPEEMEVSNIKIDSLKQTETPVMVSFNFKMTSFENADIVYFNPMVGEGLAKNPFYAAERIYPVEMPYISDYSYTLRMQIPTGYKVEELPKSVRSVFNENEALFEYLINSDANTVLLKCKLQLNTAVFVPEDYQALRSFYASIVKKEAEQIVFKKIN